MNVLWHWVWELTGGNPMAVRIVQGGSRRVRHLWVRMGYLGALILLVAIGLLSSNAVVAETTLTDLAKAGSWTFNAISYGQVTLVCLLAPLFMAGAIAQEHAGKTYDILLTTPLSNLQIVLGSLCGRLFFILSLIAGGFPIFAVLMIFGGVPIRAVFVSFSVAALTAITVGSAAVTLSVMRRGGRKAVFSFVIVISGYLVASYCLDSFLLRHIATVPGSGSDGTTWITPLHPLLVLEASFHVAGYQPPPSDSLNHLPTLLRTYLSKPLLTYTALNITTSILLITLSTVRLRRVGQSDNVGSWWSKVISRVNQTKRKSNGIKNRVWKDPIAWREAMTGGNTMIRALTRTAFLLLGIAGPATVLALYHTDRLPTLPDPFGGSPLQPHQVLRLAIQILVMVEVAAIVLIATYMSAGCISREREDGTLDLLLTTPITPKMYVWGKLKGLVSSLTIWMVVPFSTLAMASAYTLVGQFAGWKNATIGYTTITPSGTSISIQTPLIFLEMPLLMLIILLPFIGFCVTIGINWSLRAKNVFGAIVSTLAVVGSLSLVMGLCGPNAAEQLYIAGSIINALSPITYINMLIDPWENVSNFAENPPLGRVILLSAAFSAGICYSIVIYFMTASMVRTFDHSVRKLSGTA